MRLNRVAWFALTASVALAAGMIGFVPTAGAYVKESCHLSSPYRIPYQNASSSGYYSIGQTAISDWSQTPTRLTFVAQTPDKIQIKNVNYGNTSQDGLTYFGACSGGVFTSQNLSTWNTYYTSSYGTDARLQVMVHEIGHSLGLAHAGNSACAGQPIMYGNSDRYFTCQHFRPQTDDTNGINAIYGG